MARRPPGRWTPAPQAWSTASRWCRSRRGQPAEMRSVVAIGAALLVLVVATAPRWWPDHSDGSGPADRRQAGTGQEPPVLVEAGPARRTGSVRPEPPRSVRLPSGVIVRVRAVSTRPDGLLGVPGDITRAGWWRGGSAVGDPLGSTLVAA